MRLPTRIIALGLLLSSAAAVADLQPWKDYEESQNVWSVTTIRVQPNMDDASRQQMLHRWTKAVSRSVDWI